VCGTCLAAVEGPPLGIPRSAIVRIQDSRGSAIYSRDIVPRLSEPPSLGKGWVILFDEEYVVLPSGHVDHGGALVFHANVGTHTLCGIDFSDYEQDTADSIAEFDSELRSQSIPLVVGNEVHFPDPDKTADSVI